MYLQAKGQGSHEPLVASSNLAPGTTDHQPRWSFCFKLVTNLICILRLEMGTYINGLEKMCYFNLSTFDKGKIGATRLRLDSNCLLFHHLFPKGCYFSLSDFTWRKTLSLDWF